MVRVGVYMPALVDRKHFCPGGRRRSNLCKKISKFEKSTFYLLRSFGTARRMNWNHWLSAVQHGGEASSLESTLSETSLPDVLDAQRSLYSAEESLLQSRVLLATNRIALNKALGGGWDGAVDSTNPRSSTSRPCQGWRAAHGVVNKCVTKIGGRPFMVRRRPCDVAHLRSCIRCCPACL